MNVFQSLKNDRVTLVKKDGQRFENLSASVQTGLILTYNPEIPIEDGDQFERQLPSGIVDVFTPWWTRGFAASPARPAVTAFRRTIQSKVRKNTAGVPAAAQTSGGTASRLQPHWLERTCQYSIIGRSANATRSLLRWRLTT